ncbi:MAG: GIY-YIG nuclease family protein [Chitinophagaceae bacterium]|nr:GIY-YIG nuclease family protein [Chitinophagaceae bacterium]
MKEGFFNMSFTVYILYSAKYNKIYIGYTSNLIQRFYSHNELGKDGYTKKFRPWIVIYTEVFEIKPAAMKREKQLKSSCGRKWIWSKIGAEWLAHGFISVS